MLRDQEGIDTKKCTDKVVYDPESPLYQDMKKLSRTDRAVLDEIVSMMDLGLNTVILLGQTLDHIVNVTGTSKGVIKRSQTKLVKMGFLEKTSILANEYVVPFSLCWKGSLTSTIKNKGKIVNQLRDINDEIHVTWGNK